MSTVARHAVILAMAIAITLAGFEFWGRFGEALRNFLDMPTQTTTTDQSGDVFVTVLPPAKPAQNKPCPKGQVCK